MPDPSINVTGAGAAALPVSSTRTVSLRAALTFLAAAVIIATTPFVEHLDVYMLVLVLFVCVVGPAWVSWHRGQLDPFEPIHVIGLLSFFYFGLGSLWTIWNPSEIAFDIHAVAWIPQALLYCVLGYIALLVGYYGPWRQRQPEREYEERLNGNLMLFLTASAGIVGYVAYAAWHRSFDIGLPLPGLVGSLSQLHPMFVFAWALSWMLYFSGRSTPIQRLMLFGMLLPGALFTAFLTSGNKSLVTTLAGIPLICFWYARGRLPWRRILVLLLVLVFIVFPFYNTFRTIDAHLAQTERLQLTYKTISNWDLDYYWERSVTKFQSRMSLINSVAVVVRDTGRWVPYAHGKTIFLPAMAFFVPRILWPDKPRFTSGRDFGVRFRLVNPVDKKTQIASTIPGELYWNFDVIGVVVGMALWGVAMRMIYRRFGEARNLDPIRRAVFVTVLVQLAYLGEGHMAGNGVTLLRTLILLVALRWIGRQWGLLRMERIDTAARA